MFEQKTVFILGAGASWHYGYPTGEELVRKTLDKARETSNFLRRSMESLPLREPRPVIVREYPGQVPSGDIQKQWEKVWRDCEEFIKKLRQVNPLVIDYFLGQNPQLQPIGKLMIAWVILECEASYLKSGGNLNRREILSRSPRLEDRQNARYLDLTSFNDDWYRFLIHKLLNNCRVSKQLHENRIHFVTFNYDVSLEYALFNGLSAIEFLDSADVKKILGDKRILHVYGKIRDYPSDNFHAVDFSLFSNTPEDLARYSDSGTKHNAFVTFLDELYEASKNLRVIDPTDKTEDKDILSDAKKVIADAAVSTFLDTGL